jgi:hypothetical protein
MSLFRQSQFEELETTVWCSLVCDDGSTLVDGRKEDALKATLAVIQAIFGSHLARLFRGALVDLNMFDKETRLDRARAVFQSRGSPSL